MIKIAFVILHYMALKDTCECVDSVFEKAGTDDFRIIIVDNNSPDDSYKQLSDLFKDNEKVILIHNKENLGFANGNNVGFRYAKENLNPEFIVLSNNDICLIQNNFYLEIKAFYDKTGFALMGPMIVTKDGSCTSSPEDGHIFSEEEVHSLINRYKRSLFKYKNHLVILNRSNDHHTKKTVYKPVKDVIVHGSFMVFSREYIDRFDGLDNRTFMYLEEDILYLHLKKNNMISYYNPGICVYHKEDASTDNANKNNRNKEIFFLENSIKSFNVYLDILKEYGDR